MDLVTKLLPELSKKAKGKGALMKPLRHALTGERGSGAGGSTEGHQADLSTLASAEWTDDSGYHLHAGKRQDHLALARSSRAHVGDTDCRESPTHVNDIHMTPRI